MTKTCAIACFALPLLWASDGRAAVSSVNAKLTERDRVRVFVIVVDEAPPLAARRALGKQLRWLLDPSGAARKAFVPRRFPCTYIAKAQRVRKINRGYGRGYERRVERWLRALTTTRPR